MNEKSYAQDQDLMDSKLYDDDDLLNQLISCEEKEDLLTMSTTLNRFDRPDSIKILRDSKLQ